MNILLTKSTMPIIKYVALILGYLMDGIYKVLDVLHIPNIGIAIILFTLIIYILMLPLQIKQQKFSKMNSVMTPELNKIRDKYKGKTDQASVEKMNAEQQAVYAKYGVSPMGSCAQLLVQMPILFALYQVIYKIPGYIGSIKEIFEGLTTQITSISGYTDVIKEFVSANKISTLQMTYDQAGAMANDSVVDFLYKLSPSQWESLKNVDAFKGMDSVIQSTSDAIAHVNTFLGMNISDTPMSLITSSFKSGSWLLLVAAILIPVLAYATQLFNYKLMPQPDMGNDSTAATMKSMNLMMPLMSAFFCLTLPVGIGIYWIAGAVIRTLEQIFINRHLANMDMDEMIRKNKEAAEKKLEKKKETSASQVSANVHRNTKSISSVAKNVKSSDEDAVERASKNYKEGSIASKANMVSRLNENKKK